MGIAYHRKLEGTRRSLGNTHVEESIIKSNMRCHMKFRHGFWSHHYHFIRSLTLGISDRGSSSGNSSEEGPSVSSTTSNMRRSIRKTRMVSISKKNSQDTIKTPKINAQRRCQRRNSHTLVRPRQLGLWKISSILHCVTQLESIRRASLQHHSGSYTSIFFPLEEGPNLCWWGIRH